MSGIDLIKKHEEALKRYTNSNSAYKNREDEDKNASTKHKPEWNTNELYYQSSSKAGLGGGTLKRNLSENERK